MQRRLFLQRFSAAGALLGSGYFPAEAFVRPEFMQLTVMHTNDVHSRVDPFPMDGSRMQGLGGAARRAALIERIRSRHEHTLLLDSGDIFQGTPYFNIFKGEVEFRLMSEMKYDAATIGNHDFDAGVDGLLAQLPHAKFPFVITNYDFSDTVMSGRTLPYKVFQKGEIRIGVFGLGIELKGLVPESLYQQTRYLDPLSEGNRMAVFLRNEEKCDFIICLSHLGYRYDDQKVSDRVLAANSSEIDLILGGHTHTFLDRPELVRNANDRPVLINQTGWGGVRLGCIDMTFERNRKHRCVSCNNLWVE